MVNYIPHAERQMARRGISKADVEHVLSDHDVSYPSHVAGRQCYVRSIDGRRIEVVVEPDDGDHLVITAYDQLTED